MSPYALNCAAGHWDHEYQMLLLKVKLIFLLS